MDCVNAVHIHADISIANVHRTADVRSDVISKNMVATGALDVDAVTGVATDDIASQTASTANRVVAGNRLAEYQHRSITLLFQVRWSDQVSSDQVTGHGSDSHVNTISAAGDDVTLKTIQRTVKVRTDDVVGCRSQHDDSRFGITDN